MMKTFGTTAAGQAVHAIKLSTGSLQVRILTWGAVLQSLMLDPLPHSLTIGSDNLADYEGDMRYHGSLIGPVVNRISGAKADIGGRAFGFEPNQKGHITLHSGFAGTHLKVWDIVDHGATHATLALDLPDGEGGFPGNRRVTARYDLMPPATLRLTLEVTTDAPTLINFANHSYWNLDGGADWSGHRLRIDADHYLPTTPAFTPTGEIAPVSGSAYDFRTARPVSVNDPAFDTNFCLSNQRSDLRDVLWLQGRSGTSMTIATTEPGIQVFDNRPTYAGLAIEAQHWPDAPNHPDFPSILLRPGKASEQITEWRFSTPV